MVSCPTELCYADRKDSWLTAASQEADPDPDAATPLQPFFDAVTCENIASICRERGGAGSMQTSDIPGTGKRKRRATSRMAASGLTMTRHFTGVS